jgi:hypothetical protein
VAVIAAALAAPSLLPLVAGWGWTTPYDDAWIDVTTRGVFPPLLQPLFVAGVAAALVVAVRRALGSRADAPALVFGFGALAGACLALAGPRLGVIDVRFVPLAQLALALVGAWALGALAARLALADLAALGLVLVAAAAADRHSRVLRSWVDWNYSGLEAKELWPAWTALNERLRAERDDARVAVEYGAVHERAGSIRMYETLPYFSGRAALEGVYNQAATTTHAVYYLASELFARSPNPFRTRHYSSFDPESALPRLRLFNVSELVAVSPELEQALDARPDVRREASLPPYTLYRLTDAGPGYVEPLAIAPLRAPLQDWREASYRWMTRKPANRALLVFTDDERFEPVPDTWAPPPERPLPEGTRVSARLQPEAIEIETSRPGHPLLVKVSYHPRWRAEGALGPYLVSPGLMLVVPTREHIRLAYAARTWADQLGRTAFLAALALAAVARRRRQKARRGERTWTPDADELVASSVRHARLALRALPLVALAGLAALRFVPERAARPDVDWLDAQAARAYADERFDDAAEYARHALEAAPATDARRGELACVEGESLLRAGHARLAGLAFAPVVEAGSGPYRPQALYSGALARERAGDGAGALAWRTLLRHEYPGTPWADKLDGGLAAPVSGPPAPSPARSGPPPPPGPRTR